jgi:hypothetical protein
MAPPSLPADVYHGILSYLPPSTLIKCRLTSREICAIATPFTFRHVRLEAAYETSRFVHIAESDTLRPLVKEMTIDTWVGPDFSYHENEMLRMPRDYFRALPLIGRFKRLKILNLRFSTHCGNDRRPSYYGVSIDESYDFRLCVLDTVFRCLTGTWSEKRQLRLEDRARIWFDDDDDDDENDLATAGPRSRALPVSLLEAIEDQSQGHIELSCLTVSNLADYDDVRLTSSAAFQQVISSKTLRKLKLLVTTEQEDAAPENAIWLPEKYNFFESLPQTWLTPSVAQNLRVLSLFCQDYWGWNAKFDFRAVNPGSGFPNLRVLALGNYTFTHEWQIEWVASLGLQNGRGGLEELYLDDCPILCHARITGPLDSSTTTYDSSDGKQFEFSNEGYPRKDIMAGGRWPADSTTVSVSIDLRWHIIISHWKESMKGLRVFKMGHGAWQDEHKMIVSEANFGKVPRPRYVPGFGVRTRPIRLSKTEPGARRDLPQAFEDTNFLTYDCPSPPLPGEEQVDTTTFVSPKYRHGVGLGHQKRDLLQYIDFDINIGPSAWLQAEEGKNLADVSTQKMDEQAYDEIMSLVQQRNVTFGSRTAL